MDDEGSDYLLRAQDLKAIFTAKYSSLFSTIKSCPSHCGRVHKLNLIAGSIGVNGDLPSWNTKWPDLSPVMYFLKCFWFRHTIITKEGQLEGVLFSFNPQNPQPDLTPDILFNKRIFLSKQMVCQYKYIKLF